MSEIIYENHYRLSELTDKFFRGITKEELKELKNILISRKEDYKLNTNNTAYNVVCKALNNCDLLISVFPDDAVIYSYRQYEKDNNLNTL